jgi:hypothetical protein
MLKLRQDPTNGSALEVLEGVLRFCVSPQTKFEDLDSEFDEIDVSCLSLVSERLSSMILLNYLPDQGTDTDKVGALFINFLSI